MTTVDARVDRRTFAAGDIIRVLVGVVLVLVGVLVAEVARPTNPRSVRTTPTHG